MIIYYFAAGSAYVFYSLDGVSDWSQVSKLMPSDGAAGDCLGWSVSVWEKIIVVGARYDDNSAGE